MLRHPSLAHAQRRGDDDLVHLVLVTKKLDPKSDTKALWRGLRNAILLSLPVWILLWKLVSR